MQTPDVGPSAGPDSSRFIEGKAKTPEPELDRMLEQLRNSAREFARAPVRRKIEWLIEIRDRLGRSAPEMVAAAARAKGFESNSPLAGEEWISAAGVTLRNVRLLIESLSEIEREGVTRIDPADVSERAEGGLSIRSMPHSNFDKTLFPGVTSRTWLDSSVRRDTLRQSRARFYQEPDPEGRVVMILGAGNIASIPAMDVLYKMFVEGKVCLLKMNPVNDYLGPIFEKIFAPLVKRGYLAIAYGGPEVGAYLCYNERVDEVHITGSDKTHDLIVWGPPGPERENRKRSNRPLLTKRITSELGNISPILVAPGDYTEDELWFTARNIAGMVTHNASYNCNAGKLLVLPKGWRGRNELLRLLGRVFESTPTRRAYYPGSFDRFRRLTEGRERVTKYGQADESRLPWTIVHVPDPNADDPSFSIEPFCSVLSEVEVGSPEPGEFLQEATRFVNERVWGTLNVALIVHPRLEKDHAAELERAIRELRYGSVCLNYWPAGVYGFAVPPWGAYPGSTLSDIKSGIGFVHNTSMWEHVEKVVLKSPLVAFPKHVWFPDYRTLLDVAKKIVAFEQNPSLTKLPALIYSAVRA